MQRVLHYAFIFMFLAMMAGNICAEEMIVIKFSYENSPTSVKGSAANAFKQFAKEMTKNRVNVRTSKFVEESDELEALQMNDVQMVAVPLNKLTKIGMKEFEIFGMPYMFPNERELHRVTRGAIGRNLLGRLETDNMVGLAIWDNGFKDIFANSPVNKPEDLRGLAIHIMSDASGDAIENLGAKTIPLSYGKLLKALEDGNVNGTENTPSNFYFPDMPGMPKYLTLTNHSYLGYAVIVNKKFWDALPDEIQVELRAAMHKATDYANKQARLQATATVDEIRKSGRTTVIELSEEEKRLWREALTSDQKKIANQRERELINAVKKATASSAP